MILQPMQLALLVMVDHEEGDHDVIIVERLAISRKLAGSYTESLLIGSLIGPLMTVKVEVILLQLKDRKTWAQLHSPKTNLKCCSSCSIRHINVLVPR